MALHHTLSCCSMKEGPVRKRFLAEARVLRFPLKKASNVRVLEHSASATCDLNFLPKRSLLYIKSAFSFKTFKYFCGSFIEGFNICKCWPYKIEFAPWPRRITAGSINLMWSYTGTVSSGGIFFHNLGSGPITSKKFLLKLFHCCLLVFSMDFTKSSKFSWHFWHSQGWAV